MAKARIKLNKSGVREVLKSTEMQSICNEHAQRIVGKCGSGYKTDSFVGKNRCNAMVWAGTYRAKRDNSKNNTILKAVK